ncbi:MAG: WG repeat-containing protein [Bryobacteraceae bacterium]
MTEDIRKLYAVLGLPITANSEHARHVYRDLVKQFHPDRYATEPEEIRQRAQDRLREVTVAYGQLRRVLPDESAINLEPVDLGKGFGYLDEIGNVVIYPQYEQARFFHEGLAAVKAVSKWGFIDTVGEYQITPVYEDCGDFSEGLAAVKWYGRWGYIDSTGSFVVRPAYQEAKPFAGGFGAVRLGTRWGRVDRTGAAFFEMVTRIES